MTAVKHAIKRFERKLRESRAYLSLAFRVDRFLARQQGASMIGIRIPVHVLLPTAGRGNIGDQAMFESFLANTTGPVVVLVRSRQDFRIDEMEDREIRFIEVPRLVGGGRVGRKRDVRTFLRELAGARSFSIVGADVMDGGYERGEAVRRAQLLCLAGLMRVPSRVLGFSWNAHSDPVARSQLRQVSKTTLLFARDPQSHYRLKAEGIQATGAADIVFRYDGQVSPPEIARWFVHDTRPVVTINVSGLIMRKIDLSSEFAEVVRRSLALGCRVLLLPHVVRPGDDDSAACRAVFDRLDSAPSEDVLLVERLLSPSEVSWVASHSSAVLTGRMHLAILALCGGTVPITLATQGKVEGLAELFGIEELVLAPEFGVGELASLRIEEVVGSDEYASRISAALPTVRELAAQSFRGLV